MTESTDPTLRYPRLAHLLGAYLHQDRDPERPTWQAMVDHGTASEPPSATRDALRDARAVLGLAEADPARSLRDMGSEYHPPGEGLTYQEWLSRIGSRLP